MTTEATERERKKDSQYKYFSPMETKARQGKRRAKRLLTHRSIQYSKLSKVFHLFFSISLVTQKHQLVP